LVNTASINSGSIVDGAIATADITAGAITNALLGSSAVNTSNIASGAITSSLLASGSVTGSALADGGISSVDIAAGAVTSTLLADNSVLASKLSTAANTRTVSAQIGTVSVALLSTNEWPVFVAPSNGTITRITLTNKSSLSLSATAAIRKNGSTTVASTPLSALSTALTPYAMTPSAGQTFTTGDVYSLYVNATVAVNLTNFLVTIDYVPSE